MSSCWTRIRAARAAAPRARVGRGRAARHDHAEHRRDVADRAFGEGAGGRQLQARVRVPPAELLSGRDRRGARRDPAAGERRRRTPPRITSPCSGSRSRSCRPRTLIARSWSATDIGGQTHAVHQRLPRGGHPLLGRLRADRDGPRRDPQTPGIRVGAGDQRRRRSSGRRLGRRAHRPDRSVRVAARAPG